MRIRYLHNQAEKQIDLSPYLADYVHRLSLVPTYASDSSYVLKKISNVKELIEVLKLAFAQEQNRNIMDAGHNVQVQLLSRMFSSNINFVVFVRYLYYQVCSEWLKEVL